MDSSVILKKMDKAAQSAVKVGGYTFTIQRPTKYEMAKISSEKDASFFDLAHRFVVGWDGVTEADLMPSGGETAVPFDREIWRRWLEDREDFWQPISQAVMESFTRHAEQTKADKKN